ncbi:MAG: hypothetical protein HC836_37240 [Richelia sp. RM2_1_2]|nr:hypothetical protein [Richelia sp. RM2_1_2]
MTLDQILQEQFINKRVHVKIRSRDKRGKELPHNQNEFDIAGGVCTFIGANDLLSIPLQINLNDHPIRVEHVNHITLAP